MTDEAKRGSADSLTEAVWQLTLQWYAADGVQPACLALQDRHGIGVSALFALAGAAALGAPTLTTHAMDRALDRAERWQHQVIEPLRQARRAIRQAAPEEATLNTEAEALRKALLQREIAAERLQQALVVGDCLHSTTEPGVNSTLDAEAAIATARIYIARYVSRLSSDDQRYLEAIMAPLTLGTMIDPRR